MNILVTNDDGINAPGLWHLAEAMQALGTVFIVAPDREQSGVGVSISLAKALRVHKLPYSMAEVPTYSVEGTPGDAVIMGLAHISKNTPVDLVVSGVNHGANTGSNVFLSGTIGAAWHGLLRGVPAIAVSCQYRLPVASDGLYTAGAGMAAIIGREVLAKRAPSDVLYNINVPYCTFPELAGLYPATSSMEPYADEVREEDDGRGRKLYHLVFRRGRVEARKGTEVWALRNNYLTLTLLDARLSPLPRKALPPEFYERCFQELMSKEGPLLAATL